MNAITRLAPIEPMTIEQLLAFTSRRPPGERWELIDGVAIMDPSPIDCHQIIVGNSVTALDRQVRPAGATWWPMIGTGTRGPSSPASLPQPDVLGDISWRTPLATPLARSDPQAGPGETGTRPRRPRKRR